MASFPGHLAHRQGGHMTSEGWALRPEEACEMHAKASHK